MLFDIDLNEKLFHEKLNDCQYSDCIKLLKNEFKLVKNGDNPPLPKVPSEVSLNILSFILEKVSPSLMNKTDNEEELLLVKQCYISLRNSSACGKATQDFIAKNTKVISITSKLLDKLLNYTTSRYVDCLKILLQFLSNLVTNNLDTQNIVFEHFFEALSVALFQPDIADITAMIVYNILRNNTHLVEEDLDFIDNILILLSLDTENIILILELLISKNVITKHYKDLETDDRLTILETFNIMQLQETVEIPKDFIKLLSDQFKRGSDCILKTVTDYIDEIEPVEISKMLNCLASASSDHKCLPMLQKDKSLLINCAFLLKSIHTAGKEGDNDFTAIQKLSELSLEDSSVEEHPAYGFKASLIRIIGNLCWKHEDNQNLVRDLECIPLLMDCCNIDARNPLIIQWVILAIRNLCEDNSENKALIAGITKVGVVDSAILKEMGLTLNNDGENKICIAPLDLKK